MVNTAYISKDLTIPENLYKTFKTLYSSLTNSNMTAIAHIYMSGLLARKKDKWYNNPYTPINHLLIKKHGINTQALIADDIIEVKKLNSAGKEYSKAKNLSREFRLKPKIISLFLAAYEEVDEDTKWVYARDGKEVKKRYTNHKETLRDSEVQPSNIVEKGVAAIKKCEWNRKAVANHIADLKSKVEQATTEKERITAQARYICDLTIYTHLLRDSDQIDDTFSVYKPMFNTQMSGRVTELGVGLQGCTREMKKAAFYGIKDIHNYDLKSSQLYILKMLFEEAGISTVEIVKLLKEDKNERAAALGLPVDVAKSCVISLLMGASLAPLSSISSKTTSSIYEAIFASASNPELSYNKFFNRYKGIKKDIDKWHAYLVNNALKTMNRKKYITNSSNTKFLVGDYLDKSGKLINVNELERRLAAYFLQGQEATFIHILASLSSKYGFEVYSNQHDGLVTKGVIPEEAVREAKALSGFRYAALVEKAFVDSPKVKEEEKPVNDDSDFEISDEVFTIVKPARKPKKLPEYRTGEEEINLDELTFYDDDEGLEENLPCYDDDDPFECIEEDTRGKIWHHNRWL